MKSFLYAAIISALLAQPATASGQLFANQSLPPQYLLQSSTTPYVITKRGGTQDRPLGAYTYTDSPILFGTDYIATPDSLKAQFASDLHTFAAMHNGDCLSWSAADAHPTPVPYAKLESYARCWFQANYPQYRRIGLFFRDRFIYEALVDATNLYDHAAYLLSPRTTMEISCVDIDVDHVINRR